MRAATSTPTAAWRPAVWVRSLVRQKPTRWPVGRSIRAGIGVAAPLAIGALLGDVGTGMWVSMGTLLLAAGERSVPYRARFVQFATTAPLAAAAYLLGYLAGEPVLVVVVMGALAFGAGVASGRSGVLSVATMQAMLIAALAIGVPAAAPYWRSAMLFLVGAVIAAALLGVETLLNRHRPERDALRRMLLALADLADAAAGAGSRRDDLASRRAAAIAAIGVVDSMTITERGIAGGPTAGTRRAGAISRAADQLLARLLAGDVDSALCRAAAERLRVCANAVTTRRPPAPRGDRTALVRLGMLEATIWGEIDPASRPFAATLATSGPRTGRALILSAVQLSVCTTAAYVALFTLPIPRAYWIALTVALVMKPDLGSVFSRAVLRVVGTIGGAAIAVVVGLITTDPLLISLAIAVLAAMLPWAMGRSYAMQALALTPLIMLLINLVDPGASVLDLSVARIATTAVGGAIVIVFGYLIWPGTRHPSVAAPFAAAISALQQYATTVAAGASADTVAQHRLRAYGLLSDAAVVMQRRLDEPPPAGAEAWAWIPIVAAGERVADRITDASATRAPTDVSADVPVLAALARQLGAVGAAPATVDDAPAGATGANRAAAGDGAASAAAERTPTPPADGGDDPDPAVRELADEIAALIPMVAHR